VLAVAVAVLKMAVVRERLVQVVPVAVVLEAHIPYQTEPLERVILAVVAAVVVLAAAEATAVLES
jgi:hypothetical protein